MESSYIITFIGDDRPGLVEQLSRVIEANGGNWLESQLSQLGGKFAGLILVTLPAQGGEQLETELKNLSSSGLSVRVTPAENIGSINSAQPPPSGRRITLRVLGPDRPGIVREISRALAERQINVIAMESDVSSAAMSGEMMFRAEITAQIASNDSASADFDELLDSLEQIANQMTLDIDLE